MTREQSAPSSGPGRWPRIPPLPFRLRIDERTVMIVIAIVIGLAGGLGAVFFRWLIGFLQDLAWGPAGSALDKFARSPLYLRILVPATGGLLIGLIVKFLAPEVKGHGVPEVMNAVARSGGVIRPMVAVAKSLASAICIAVGGSVGREGPIVQIGASIGSSVAQVLHLSTRRIRTCVGCGAAAGIAATFNAPIAGAFFAAEVILGEFGLGAFGPVLISSVVATAVSRSLLGDVLAFSIPTYEIVHAAELLNYAILGLLAGVTGVLFVIVLGNLEGVFERMRRMPDLLKPVIGGAAIGGMGWFLPEIMGVGYDTISNVLHGGLGTGFLIAILFGKLVATSLTLGSGGSGGIFAPSLFMGAALGAAVGGAAQVVLPFPMAPAGAYAVVGMGAMVAAATHAPITAILIIFEMTGDYRIILGLMISCVLGTLVAQHLRKESIYTVKLARRGIDLHAGRELNVLREIRVSSVLRPEVETVSRAAGLSDLYDRMVHSRHNEFFVLDDDGDLIGVVSVGDLRRALPDFEPLSKVAIAEDLMSQPVIYLREDDTLDRAMQQFGKRSCEDLPVLPRSESRSPIGTVRRQDVINAYNRHILKVDLAGSFATRIESAAQLRTWETVGDYVLAHVEVPPHLCGRTLESLGLRQRLGVHVILIERSDGSEDRRFVLPGREAVANLGDRMIIFGRQADVDALVGESQ